VLVLEWKRWSRLRSLQIGLLGVVTGSPPGATPYQTFEHEDEHDLVAATPRCALALLRLSFSILCVLTRDLGIFYV